MNTLLQYQKCVYWINTAKQHRAIKMKPVDVKSSTYNDFNKENNKEDHKFKNGDHVRVW